MIVLARTIYRLVNYGLAAVTPPSTLAFVLVLDVGLHLGLPLPQFQHAARTDRRVAGFEFSRRSGVEAGEVRGLARQ